MPGLATRRFKVYGAYTTLGWRVVRHCRLDAGQKMVASGEWEQVEESNGDIAFQLKSPDRALKGDYDMRSSHTSSAISGPSRKDTPQRLSEMEMFAGMAFPGGRSRTMWMAEDDERRLTRRRPEDATERMAKKIAVWPLVGSRKGDVVRAWAEAGI